MSGYNPKWIEKIRNGAEKAGLDKQGQDQAVATAIGTHEAFDGVPHTVKIYGAGYRSGNGGYSIAPNVLIGNTQDGNYGR